MSETPPGTPADTSQDKSITPRQRVYMPALHILALLWYRFKSLGGWAASELYAGVAWCATHLSRWPWIAGIALALIGTGANAMFSEQITIARVLIYLGIGLLACKAISEVKGHEKRIGATVAILLVGAFFVVGTEFLITSVEQKKRVERVAQMPNPIVQPQPAPSIMPSPSPQITATETTLVPMPTPSPSSPVTKRPKKTVRKTRRTAGPDEEQRWILQQLNSNKNAHANAAWQGNPITKEELKAVLGGRKLTKKGLNFLVEQVRRRGVAFSLTPEIEQELRGHAAKRGNKSIDAVIEAIQDLELMARVQAVLSKASPSPTPDWRASDEAKKLAAEMMADVEKLADEGRVMDLTDLASAIKVFKAWVDKCSVGLGRIDIQMRRFNRRTNYRSEWDRSSRDTFSPRYIDNEDKQKEGLRIEVNIAISELGVIRSNIAIQTLPGVDEP